MKICGIKLTHDGAVALIDDNKLVFSIEMEKLNNNPRFESIEHMETVKELLNVHGYQLEEIDLFALDGWGGTNQDALAVQPRLTIGDSHNYLSVFNQEKEYNIGLAPYREDTLKDNVLKEWSFDSMPVDTQTVAYKSYLHVAAHIMSAYCTSPAAARGESAYVLVWDGGMYPRLYFVDSEAKQIHNLGPIFLLIGNIYTIFSQHFGPFKVKGSFAKDNLSIAGKVMAYIALGAVREELFPLFDKIYKSSYDKPMGFANVFANEFKEQVEGTGFSDEDILRTFHTFLEKLLIEKLSKKISRQAFDSSNLCIAGGCALNIKWNSSIRNTGIFKEVYVPPFPNDSGSAIGAACCAMFNHTSHKALDWSVYSGPEVVSSDKDFEGWKTSDCSLERLAHILYTTNEPVVYLSGKAEIGPRALGNRSILAAPSSPGMKEVLNRVKKREAYRPISPICLEERAQEIFVPGTSDPFMLFDHRVKPEWLNKIPAVVHLDETSRLQTVAPQDNPEIFKLLKHFEKVSSLPLLCNTSANFNGKGFFPDVESVIVWGQVNYIYSDGKIYERIKPLDFPETESREQTELEELAEANS